MKILHGLSAPAGEGTILEVHLDIQTITRSFSDWLESVGFENDPFVIFYPGEYSHHMTGRTRAVCRDLPVVVEDVEFLVEQIVDKAQSQGIDLYTETELARETTRFPNNSSVSMTRVLDELTFARSGKLGGAKADVHVEFKDGTVDPRVREYLLEKNFYWVSTPPTALFPAEEIATLQTSTYRSAREVYDILVARPFCNCTAIHLEQKLSMKATKAGLPMPEVIEVVCR